MNIIRQYIKKRLFQFSFSVLFAILSVLAGLISYMILASLIAELINRNLNWELYSNKLLIIAGMFLFKEILAGISTTISHTATFHVVSGELKTKPDKNLFRKLNEHSKKLQAKQEEIAKKHSSLLVQYEELEHLKDNMNDYLGRNKTEDKKESVIGAIKRHYAEDKEKPKEKKEASKEAER